MTIKNIMFSGVMAVILGGVVAPAMAVEVTSKKYVDGKVVAAVASKAEQSALSQEITDRKAADSAIEAAYKAADTTLSGQISSEALARENADNSLQSQINNKAEQAYVGTIPTDASSQNVVDYVIERTSGLASEGVIEGKLNKNLGTENANKVVVTDASGAITAAAKIEQAQVNGLVDALGAKAAQADLENLATEVADKANASDLKNWVLTETYDAGQKTQDDAITALQTKTANMATTTDVDTAKSGAISEAAADAATKYAAIAYEGKVGALEASQATQDAAIEALQGFETGIAGASVSENGTYVLTKVVSQNAEGQEVTTYGWELITR